MDTNQLSFPTKSRLWHGAVLRTIAHAIWIASDPTLSYEASWDEMNYSRQDTMGSRGTITFGKDYVIGVFFDLHSPRSPFQSGKLYDPDRFFMGMPAHVMSLAKEQTLQYIVDTYEGKTVPIVTAAFWSEGERLTAVEPWKDVLANGAHLVNIEFMETEVAVRELQENYELPPSQIKLVRSLFDRKVSSPDVPIVLSHWDREVLRERGDLGVDESRKLLGAIGLVLP